MSRLKLIVAALAVGVAAPAAAADLPAMPSMTVDPSVPAPDYWKGLYVGTGIGAVVAKGQKGQFGGDVFAGYDHAFDNGLVLGVQFDTGYDPWVCAATAAIKGFDFAETERQARLRDGPLHALSSWRASRSPRARISASALPDASTSINGVCSAGPARSGLSASPGVGVDYAVTNNLHVGVAAYVNNGGGLFAH